MLHYKRLDKFLTHAVWLILVEEHGEFSLETKRLFNVFVTKRAADRWLEREVFKYMLDTNRVSEVW